MIFARPFVLLNFLFSNYPIRLCIWEHYKKISNLPNYFIQNVNKYAKKLILEISDDFGKILKTRLSLN